MTLVAGPRSAFPEIGEHVRFWTVDPRTNRETGTGTGTYLGPAEGTVARYTKVRRDKDGVVMVLLACDAMERLP